MKIGYARVSTNDQSLDLQFDALINDGVSKTKIYHDYFTGAIKERPYFDACLKSLRSGDTLVVYALDRLGRSTKDLIDILNELKDRNIDLKILDGLAKGIDTSTPMGAVFFTIASALSEYEREVIRARTVAGLAAARARGRFGGRKPSLSVKQLKTAQAAINGGAVIKDLAHDLNVSTKTIYQYISPAGEFREPALKLIKK